MLFLSYFNYAKPKADTLKKVSTFVTIETGIGASNVIYKSSTPKQNFNASFQFNVLYGVKIKYFSVSIGVGLANNGYKFKNIGLSNGDLINDIIDKADLYVQKYYFNIPILFKYSKITKKKIYPKIEFGFNNLIYLGSTNRIKNSSLPEYPNKLTFTNSSQSIGLKKYRPAFSVDIGFGIKLKKGFCYEISASYLQLLTDSYKKSYHFDKLALDYPYSIGIKTGFVYSINNK